MRNPFAALLGRSPLRGVVTLMDRVEECASKVEPIFEALAEGDYERVHFLAKEISVLEGRADEAKNAVRDDMPPKMFLPVDRRDVLILLSCVDGIADCAEDVGVLLTMRRTELPPEMRTLLILFIERVMDTVRVASNLVQSLDRLMATSFGSRATREAQALIEELARKEHEADKVQDQIAKVLFSLEDRLSPVSILMWTKILNRIGDMANYSENVGDQFRLFLAR